MKDGLRDGLNNASNLLILIVSFIVAVIFCCCACMPVYRWLFPDGPFA